MNRPKKPAEKNARKESSQPSRRRDDQFNRTIPDSKLPTVERQRERIVNEDEQLKTVNNREDNAQAPEPTNVRDDERASAPQKNENDRIEAGYDNSEVNPRPPKVM
jgi:hypothetical protein